MSRRKVILIIDPNPIYLSIRSFVVSVWGYNPLKAKSSIGAMKILKARMAYSVDLILIGDGITSTEVLWIADQAVKMLHFCPIYGAGMDVGGNELRSGIKQKTSRKRGPRAKPQMLFGMEKAA